MPNLGDRIRELRKALNLSQEQFADKLGIGHAHVSKIEKGNGTPSEMLLRNICGELYVSRTWLTTGEGEMFLSAEDIVKEQIDRLGERAFYQALNSLQSDQAVVVMESALVYRAELDPDLDDMIRFLKSLWMTGDEKLKAWAVVQFSRAFPPDIKEEILKKGTENSDQATG